MTDPRQLAEETLRDYRVPPPADDDREYALARELLSALDRAAQNLADFHEERDRALAAEARAAAYGHALRYYAERRNHTTMNDGTPHLWTNDSYDDKGPGARARGALAAAEETK